MHLEFDALENEKYWNELLQALTSDDSYKMRKSEIDSLMATETVEFHQHLNFYNHNVEDHIKKIKDAKSKTGHRG